MPLLKFALPLTLGGLVAGITIAFLITPRYVAIGVVAVRGEYNAASVNLSNEEIAAIIENRPERLFEDERTRMPYQAIAIARSAIRISIESPAAQSLTLIRVRATYRDRRGAEGLANGVIGMLFKNQASGQREQALHARIEQLKVRLAALQAHAPVPPALPPSPISLEILDYPTGGR